MIRLSLLGAVEVDGSGEGGNGLPSHTRRLALLAYLALKRPRGFVRRDSLLPLFWAELDQARARKALRQAVYVLRKELSPEVVESRGGDELFVSPEHIWCDAVAFEEALKADRPEEALDLYRGDLLPGFHLTGAPEFIDWLERERYRLKSLAVDAARRLALDSVETGDLDDGVSWAQKWLSLSPDDEQAVEQATRLMAQAGDRTGALRLYGDFKERLEREYDLTPSPVLEELAKAVREGRVAGPVPQSASSGPPAPRPEHGQPLPPIQTTARRSWWAPTAGIAAVVLAGAMWLWGGSAESQFNGEPATVVAVLPFSVQGDPSFAYLQEGMVDLLSTSLNGAGPFRTVDPATLLAAIGVGSSSLEVAGAAGIARGVGAQFFVLGNVVEAAGSIRVSARLYDLAGSLQGEAEGTAEEEGQVFQLVDLVARDLLASRYGSPELRLRGVAARTTTSLPALKAYLAAERALRVDHPAEALAEARRAVTLDPDFALAHYRLSTAAAWMNQPSVALKSARDAMGLSDQLGPRDRMLLRAHFNQQERRFQDAIDGYRAVVAEQPDHVEGWFKLGEVLFHSNPVVGRPIDEADEPFARTLALDPNHVAAALHRARLAALRGEVAVVDSVLVTIRGLGARAEAELELMALQAALRPETEGAVIDAFTSGRPAAQLNAAIWSRATFASDLPGAERLTRIAMGAVSSLEWQAVYRVRLAYLALAQGRWQEAWDELTRAEALDPGFGLEEKALVVTMPFLGPRMAELDEVRRKLEAWDAADPPTLLAGRAAREGLRGHLRLYLLGMVQAQAGDPEAAYATAVSLRSMPDPEWPDGLVESWATGVQAFALHAEGREEEARLLLAAEGRGQWGIGNPPAMTQSAERYLWATLEAASGDPAVAESAFRTFSSRRIYHLPFVAPAALQSARLLARSGRLTEARAAYGDFLDAWSECDEGLRPLRDAAEEELEQLGAAGR